MDIGVYGARSIPSTYSGYETFLTTLLPALAARGHRVTMYCRATEHPESTLYRGVRRVVLPAVPGKQLNTLSHGAVAAVRARLARHDVVLVVNVANALFCGLARWTGQPVVLNTDGQEWLRGKWGRAARGFFHLSARLSRHSATALVSDCAAMAAIYREEFGADSTVIPYCSPQTAQTPDPGVPARYGVEPGAYYLIAARFNPENNLDHVAAAYAATGRPTPLLVLGTANYDSPVRSRLEVLAREAPQIRLLGHVGDREEFLSLIAHARAYLHSHSVGGMNPSLVEAMHVGALVGALATPFNVETVGAAGLLFDLDGAGDGLPRLLDHIDAMPRDRSEALRAAARERVTLRFDVDAVVAAYESLLAAAVGAPLARSISLRTHWAVG
jgi:glycosyltransferase involved in cell wall biosynthesis